MNTWTDTAVSDDLDRLIERRQNPDEGGEDGLMELTRRRNRERKERTATTWPESTGA